MGLSDCKHDRLHNETDISLLLGNFRTSADYHYQTLRCNVDLLKMIQLGVTFADENGNVPKDACTWQFNFKFSLA